MIFLILTFYFQINISGSLLTKFLDLSKDDENINETILDDIKKSVVLNLSDTYSRFMLSFDYINLTKKKQLMKELDVIE